MSSPKFRTSVVVPCHNSRKFIEKTMGLLYSQLKADEELILVENGSTDNTLAILNSTFGGGKLENVIVTQSEKGLGFAIKHGVELARGKTIVFMEDDLPFGLQELDLSRSLETTGKYFILSKYHRSVGGFGLRRLQGLTFILLREVVLRLNVKDSQATFLGDAIVVKKLAGFSNQIGFLVTLEFIALARKLGIEIVEIACVALAKAIRPTTVKPRDVFQMFTGLFEIRRYLLNFYSEKFPE